MENFDNNLEHKKNNVLNFPLLREEQETVAERPPILEPTMDHDHLATQIEWKEWILTQGIEQALFSKPMLSPRFENEFQFWEEQKLKVSKLLRQQSYLIRKMKHLEKRLGNTSVIH